MTCRVRRGVRQRSDSRGALTSPKWHADHPKRGCRAKSPTSASWSAQQKNLDVQKQNQTAQLQAAAYDSYTDASGTIDAMMGLLGKNTTEAEKLRTIRSKVRRHNDVNPPAPAPTAKS